MSKTELPVDSMRSLEGIDRKRKKISNSRHLHMLDVLKEHFLAEFEGDLERIMNTLVPEPEYHFWGPAAMSMDDLVGSQAVRQYYTMLIESGGNLHEPSFDRFIVDDDGLFSDSIIKVMVRGALLEWMTKDNPPEKLDLNGTYLSVQRSSVVITFSEEGLMRGEDVYSDERRELIRVS